MPDVKAATATATTAESLREDAEHDPGSCVFRKLSRKRVLISSEMNSNKKKRGNESRLEALPEELLIKVLCRANHEDLDQLVRVSKIIRKAALVAKTLHFAYSTPTKASPAFRNSIDLEEHRLLHSQVDDDNEIIELEPPKMKLRRNVRPRSFDAMKMAALAVALFTDNADI